MNQWHEGLEDCVDRAWSHGMEFGFAFWILGIRILWVSMEPGGVIWT